MTLVPASSRATDPSAAVDSVFTRTGAVVAASGDYAVGQVTGAAPLAGPTFTGTVTVPAAVAVTAAPRLNQLSPVATVVSGALATQQLVSGTGAQIITTRDAETHTPVTFNPGVATTATCQVELSPDNTTYSSMATWTVPVGVALDGTIQDVTVRVPAGWYLRLTVNAQAALGVTTKY